MSDSYLLVAFLVVTLIALAVIVVTTRWKSVVSVNDAIILHADRAAVERITFGPLGSIPSSQLTSATPGQVTITSSWTPTWAVFVGILTIPIGLLLLLLVRQTLTLHVRFLNHEGGTLVQVAGKARKKVALAVGEAFNQMQ